MAHKVYLGDAVYVEQTDYGLKLTTEDGIRATNTIEMEGEVVDALMKYIRFLTGNQE